MRASLIQRSMGSLIPPKIATPSSLVSPIFSTFIRIFANWFTYYVRYPYITICCVYLNILITLG